MLDLPFSLDALFMATTFAAYLFILSSLFFSSSDRVRRRTHIVALVLLFWLIFQSTLALNRWYMDRESIPPHLMFPVATAALIMLVLFLTSRGKRFIDGLNLEMLTWLHIVRIPVEISLYLLATWKQVPWSMTFSGHNFDILSGITAPLIAWLGVRKGILSPRIQLAWNVGALVLLFIVVITGIGAAPTPLQAWDFAQPNYAVMHFPYIWLPSFVVPVVAFSHLVAIRRLIHATRRSRATMDA